MELNEFAKSLKKSIFSNETCSFFCECHVNYSGRAQAELGLGERLLVLKSDNTLLIHQETGSNPINYMKSDTAIKIVEGEFEKKKAIILETYNSGNKDYLDVAITKVFSFNSRKLLDGKKLVLVGTEKDMSDMIKDNPILISEDFIPLSREEHTKFGFIDVFGHDDNGNLIVVECKRYTAGLSAVQQLRRYVEKIEELKGISSDNIKGILAAPDIAKNALDMLEKWNFSFKKVQPPKRLERYNQSQKDLFDF